MQSNTIAAEVISRLEAEPGRRRTIDDLARLCGRPSAEVEAACALLRRWMILKDAEDGQVALKPGRPAPASLVLVVENTAAVAHVVGALLESEGYPGVTANGLQ